MTFYLPRSGGIEFALPEFDMDVYAVLNVSAWVILAVFTVVCAIALKKIFPLLWWSFWHRRDLLSRLPSPPGLNLLRGHLPADELEHKAAYIRWADQLRRMFVMMVSVVPIVTLVHPDTISAGLRVTSPKLAYFYGFMTEFIGEGLLTSEGKKWKRARKLMHPMFHNHTMRKYIPLYKSAMDLMIEKWTDAAIAGDEIEIEKDFSLLTCDVILRCAMGVESHCQIDDSEDSKDIRFIRNIRWLSAATTNRMSRLWQHNSFFFFRCTPTGREFVRRRREMVDYCKEVIECRRRQLDARNPTHRLDPNILTKTLLDYMLEAVDAEGRGAMDGDELVDQVCTLMDAGHDTTSYTLQWAMHYLALHQDVQTKCRQEIRRLRVKIADIDALIQEDLTELVYLNQFLNEVHRHASVVSIIGRTLDRDTTIDDAVIRKGTHLQVNIVALNYNPDVWENPEVFDPDRFAPGNYIKPYSFMPFGAGSRRCIAKQFATEEMLVVLTLILATFRVFPADENQIKKPPGWRCEAVGRPVPAVRIKVEGILL